MLCSERILGDHSNPNLRACDREETHLLLPPYCHCTLFLQVLDHHRPTASRGTPLSFSRLYLVALTEDELDSITVLIVRCLLHVRNEPCRLGTAVVAGMQAEVVAMPTKSASHDRNTSILLV
ncbi:hypothetical protein MIND_00532800 [Mycena indigotica]|uniref:Uncharacterized protein n=1 Tax=Mycena indigotica TaxID=2126181 RepID=A0A8H6SZ11_9AGAR|nr:uncharacterized protein MIND_00532800 [Mycena indigotica]KAF7307387.1 hypothetical protein MIND_00532800 [Mycena indigotica]